MDAPSLEGEQVALRALTDEDVPRVIEMNALPEVARWWNPRDPDYVRSKLGEDDLACWVVEVDGRLAGFVQAYEHTHPEFRHAGLDLFLHPALHGRGLGRDVVRTVCTYLLEERGHHRLVTDPAAANAVRSAATKRSGSGASACCAVLVGSRGGAVGRRPPARPPRGRAHVTGRGIFRTFP